VSDPRRRIPRRRLLGVAAAGVLVPANILALVLVIAPWVPSRPPPADGSASVGAAEVNAIARNSALASQRSKAAAEAAALAGRAGAGIDSPGIYLQVSARPDGSLDVSERIVLRATVSRLRLEAPTNDGADSAFADSDAVVTGLQVKSANKRVPNIATRVDDSRTVPIPRVMRSVALTLIYRLEGTRQDSASTSGGRSAAYVRPLTAAMDDSLPVQVHMIGTGTTSLTCPQLPTALRDCGEGTAPILDTGHVLTARTSTVLIRGTLPRR
jgi:hypothetical protein